jgi:sulfur-carrier protein
VAHVRLPGTLTPLFPGLPRRVEVDAATVLAAIDSLETQWPGLRDRIVEEGPTLRRHLHVYVDGERAGLETPVAERSRMDVIAAISGG